MILNNREREKSEYEYFHQALLVEVLCKDQAYRHRGKGQLESASQAFFQALFYNR